VEGSITTAEDEKRIQAVRQDSKFLVTIGACATAGGIQALRNWQDVEEFTRAVYATPAYIHTLKQSTPISYHVAVDFEVNGCPINKMQILEVITSLLVGRAPDLPGDSVCMECKRRGTVCVMVAHGLPCLGPLTQTGCGAICPAYNRGCYGCFGPVEAPNSDSLSTQLLRDGMQRSDLVRLFREFTGFAEAFRSAGDKWDKPA
jgi:coenzyme F420-reducing hydrogenase gamma subunit